MWEVDLINQVQLARTLSTAFTVLFFILLSDNINSMVNMMLLDSSRSSYWFYEA
jgi:hypothetical protein